MNARLSAFECPMSNNVAILSDIDCGGCIDAFYSDIVECFRDVCKLCVPKKGGMNMKNDLNMKSVLGWNDNVARLPKEARMHYKVWREADSPRDGDVYDMMYLLRKCCKARLRQLRRDNITSLADNLARNLLIMMFLGFGLK